MSTIRWTEEHTDRSARRHSESGAPQPIRIVVVDDRIKADTAYELAADGATLLWRGDFHNGRQLLSALRRRVDRRSKQRAGGAFQQHRRLRGDRARILGRLVVLLDEDYALELRRAPDVRQACREAYGPPSGRRTVSLTELLGVLGAHQWRMRGVEVPALGARIHPHYGVFSPVRGEYVELVARAPLPEASDGLPRTAFDLGTGTGVLAAVLARRGFDRIIATDNSSRALACARDNIDRLGLADRVEITGPTLYPEGRAHLVVCNPPWLPERPTSILERGVYDENGEMLDGFLAGLTDHLAAGGEGWLILSDLAEHLGLRAPGELPDRIAAAGLRVVDRLEIRPRHRRPRNAADPLHRARIAEITSLWRLRPG
ncbi:MULTISPECIES: class I SAM-dependent methyltransferase [unclassified Nocardia]|uniref:methyltransferase n=1 Tax=unclassified Nocardia TaxID=2637762 RepID=UPI001CE3C03F|nr:MULTISPECIES: class I SAM-dependent methyltransferase [unclassified Nocardia]